ncbi:PRTRC genetic system protein A [Herbaspirillum sp. 1173]|jgi:PRTRC genetic system protein A|uniref:PRTRC system protein A n=1 Tax=Herbaspirillum sp. 1173 TaxID=2817734 RepID=UPI002859DB3B|nr:PRTRC system protein A [Herbaspirillum sp. 1173]MDR6739614.1 PRTRC genetic system protein A [Herbaspirillum sp. 1173]
MNAIAFDKLQNTITTAIDEIATLRKAAHSLHSLYPIAGAGDDPAAPLDQASFLAAPVAVVPQHGMFVPIEENKHRFLLARDGLYLEVRRPWLHSIVRLSEQRAVAMPFGEISPRNQLAFGRLSCAIDLMRAFARQAMSNLPNEDICHIAWDSEAGQLVPVKLQIEDATPGSVRYRTDSLPAHQSLAIDIHSHGSMPAFFSDQDNLDDAGSVKFAGVIGNLDSDSPTVSFRLCMLGLYAPITVPVEKLFGG